MLGPILYIVAAIGGGIGIYYVFRKMQIEDRDLVKKMPDHISREFKRQVWIGGIIRHAIFALAIVAAGGGLLFFNIHLEEVQSVHYSYDNYYIATGLILVGAFWLFLIINKFLKEEKGWREPPAGSKP